jgi:GT2 family glycosyltransferase
MSDMKVDIIILSNAIDEEIWKMNLNCIDSLLESENDGLIGNIILVESNKQSEYKYPDKVKIVIPAEDFNFNKFLNIGIKESKADFVGLCNNDLIFFKNWFSEILKVKESRPEIRSFSPVDYDYYLTPETRYPKTQAFYTGYDIRTLIAGWCIVVDRKVFDVTGLLDERFDFYYADNDYSMTLRKYNIIHALIPGSHVKHLGSANTKKEKSKEQVEIKNNRREEKKRRIPKEISGSDSIWITENPKMMEGYFKFHDKWGSNYRIKLKKRIIHYLPFIQEHFSRLYW